MKQGFLTTLVWVYYCCMVMYSVILYVQLKPSNVDNGWKKYEDGTTRLLAIDSLSESHTCALWSLASGVVWWVMI